MNKDCYDWISAKMEYMTGSCRLEDIAKKYNIPFSSIRKRSADEAWKSQRVDNMKKVQETAQEFFNEKAANAHANNLEREFKIAQKISDLLEKATNEQIEVPTLDEFGNPSSKIDIAALEKVAKILKQIEEVKRSICGLTTAQEDRLYNLNIKRLEIEEKRLRNDTGEDEEGGGVLILPESNPINEDGGGSYE